MTENAPTGFWDQLRTRLQFLGPVPDHLDRPLTLERYGAILEWARPEWKALLEFDRVGLNIRNVPSHHWERKVDITDQEITIHERQSEFLGAHTTPALTSNQDLILKFENTYPYEFKAAYFKYKGLRGEATLHIRCEATQSSCSFSGRAKIKGPSQDRDIDTRIRVHRPSVRLMDLMAQEIWLYESSVATREENKLETNRFNPWDYFLFMPVGSGLMGVELVTLKAPSQGREGASYTIKEEREVITESSQLLQRKLSESFYRRESVNIPWELTRIEDRSVMISYIPRGEAMTPYLPANFGEYFLQSELNAANRPTNFNRALESVLSVHVKDLNGPISRDGSGVLISNDGYIVTNRHVVDYEHESGATLEFFIPQLGFMTARLVYVSEELDLALLKVDAPHPLPCAQFRADMRQGRVAQAALVNERVWAIGFPAFNRGSIHESEHAHYSDGVARYITVGSRGRLLDFEQVDQPLLLFGSEASPSQYIENSWVTDAPVYYGMSGGGLFDQSGALVGITHSATSLVSDDVFPRGEGLLYDSWHPLAYHPAHLVWQDISRYLATVGVSPSTMCNSLSGPVGEIGVDRRLRSDWTGTITGTVSSAVLAQIKQVVGHPELNWRRLEEKVLERTLVMLHPYEQLRQEYVTQEQYERAFRRVAARSIWVELLESETRSLATPELESELARQFQSP